MRSVQVCILFWFIQMLPAEAGTPIDIQQLPITDEMYLVAIDIQVNPTNMPSVMLWDKPIMLVYRQVANFSNLSADVIRSQAVSDFEAGDYRPVVIRTRINQDLTLHLTNLIGEGDAPERVVQGVACKSCKDKRAYVFGYKAGTERSQHPYKTSIHGHGMSYTIDNDGTAAGMNVADDARNNGLIGPGEAHTYYYQKLDSPGVWPLHDHANPAHSVARGLHMALVVEPTESVKYDHDFLIVFSDYPEYQDYLDSFYSQTFIPAFLHMRNGNVMHAHALNGYAAMLRPRMNMAVAGGNTRFDALRTDILPEPKTPLYQVEMGKLVRFRLLSMGSANATHSFHIHGHVWYDKASDTYMDNVAVPSGSSYDLAFYAGGQAYRRNIFRRNTNTLPMNELPVRGFVQRSGVGDWLYHCHIIPHVKHGMWGLFRVTEPAPKPGEPIDL